MIRPSLLVAAAVLVAGVPVPTPVHVQPGVADADGTVAWSPPVQVVTGNPGEVVAVDVALDDGTEHEVVAELAVRDVDVDPVAGPTAGARSDLLTLAVGEIALGPGDRGVLRATAVVPPQPRLVAVEARLVGDVAGAAPLALVLVGPALPVDLTADVTVARGRAVVTLVNRSAFPTVVDVGAAASSWFGGRTDVAVTDVVVAGGGRRELELELAPGLGRRRVDVAVAARGAPGGGQVDASVAVWPARSVWFLAAAFLVVLAGVASLRVLRRS